MVYNYLTIPILLFISLENKNVWQPDVRRNSKNILSYFFPDLFVQYSFIPFSLIRMW